jgi:hypothetical protein
MNQYRSLENRIRDVVRSSRARLRESREQIEKDPNDQIVAGTYKTKNFEMCPGAQKLFTSLPKDVNPDDAEKSAILHDQLFALEKQTIAKERSTQPDIDDAHNLVDKIKMYSDKMGVSNRDNYLEKHIKKIESYKEPDTGPMVKKVDSNSMMRLQSPPNTPTKEKADNDIDNTKFTISRNIKAKRKLKIIDAD